MWIFIWAQVNGHCNKAGAQHPHLLAKTGRPLILQNNNDQPEVTMAHFLLCATSAGHRLHAQKYNNSVGCSEAS